MAIGCAPELETLATVPPARLLASQRTWDGDGGAVRPVLAERRRTRVGDRWWKPGAPAVVLGTADGARCDTFVSSAKDLAGPFFGFPGSTAAWRAEVHLRTTDSGHFVVVVLDDRDSVRALYEHEHEASLGAGAKVHRVPFGDADGLLVAESSSAGSGRAVAYLEILGLSPSGEPQRLLELHGSGPAPHALASVVVWRRTAAVSELESITSQASPDVECVQRKCLLCARTRYVWDAKSGKFEPSGRPAGTTCSH
jgi:hypothetical protein